ncbi:hypothetical protein HanPI659440_Chr10g0398291 [Helianthus annuus]|nr:hypothetical protein HanPI659440_Chr10g0398291 [Helianthus annuus]
MCFKTQTRLDMMMMMMMILVKPHPRRRKQNGRKQYDEISEKKWLMKKVFIIRMFFIVKL